MCTQQPTVFHLKGGHSLVTISNQHVHSGYFSQEMGGSELLAWALAVGTRERPGGIKDMESPPTEPGLKSLTLALLIITETAWSSLTSSVRYSL